MLIKIIFKFMGKDFFVVRIEKCGTGDKSVTAFLTAFQPSIQINPTINFEAKIKMSFMAPGIYNP